MSKAKATISREKVCMVSKISNENGRKKYAVVDDKRLNVLKMEITQRRSVNSINIIQLTGQKQ